MANYPKIFGSQEQTSFKDSKKAKTYLNLSNINSAENDLAYVNFKKSIFSPTPNNVFIIFPIR